MLIEKFDGQQDVVEYVDAMDYDTEILAFDEPIAVRCDCKVVAVGNYAENRIEIVTDDEAAAMAVCKHYANQIVREIDCSNEVIAESLQGLIDRPFAHLLAQ